MVFKGALHVHTGDVPPRAVERAIGFSRECGWGAHVGIGSELLPARTWTRLCHLRERYRPMIGQAPAGVPVIYHQLAGLDLFATEDAGRHRLFWIHEPFVRWSTVLGWAARYADAFIFDDPAWEAEALETIQWIPARRRIVIPSSKLHASNGAIGDLSAFLELAIKRQKGSPSGVLNVFGFYRRQLDWLV